MMMMNNNWCSLAACVALAVTGQAAPLEQPIEFPHEPQFKASYSVNGDASVGELAFDIEEGHVRIDIEEAHSIFVEKDATYFFTAGVPLCLRWSVETNVDIFRDVEYKETVELDGLVLDRYVGVYSLFKDESNNEIFVDHATRNYIRLTDSEMDATLNLHDFEREVPDEQFLPPQPFDTCVEVPEPPNGVKEVVLKSLYRSKFLTLQD